MEMSVARLTYIIPRNSARLVPINHFLYRPNSIVSCDAMFFCYLEKSTIAADW